MLGLLNIVVQRFDFGYEPRNLINVHVLVERDSLVDRNLDSASKSNLASANLTNNRRLLDRVPGLPPVI